MAYIGGILDQSGIAPVRSDGDGYWMNIPSTSLVSVFQMLDTHRRRLVKRASKCGDIPLGYRFGRQWFFSGPEPIICWIDPDIPEPAKFHVSVSA